MMTASMHKKLVTLLERQEELSALLSDASIINDQLRFSTLSKEYAQLEPLVHTFQKFRDTEQQLEETQSLLADADAELKSIVQEELQDLSAVLETLEASLQTLLLPNDPDDARNVFLEIRAGTGGDEAAIFSGDLFRMYANFADQQGWRVEIISESDGDHGGYKEIIARIIGQNVYSQLKFEAGAHRVQRVPTTESQGRIHTSACTVAILPEVEAVDAIDLNMNDVRVDTFRASGAGGQHVNKTDSAIRLTHLPSGIVVECQDERSQHKNRARAIALLQAKLLRIEREEQQKAQAQSRKLQVGSGDRSERIRTYNFPQGRVTDHRINLTLYKLEDILSGDLHALIQPLQQEHQAELLAEME